MAMWVPLVEFWYNTNFYTTIKTTPFEALYGYAPPQLSLGSVPKSYNQTINEDLERR
jgi:hypothetical protein